MLYYILYVQSIIVYVYVHITVLYYCMYRVLLYVYIYYVLYYCMYRVLLYVYYCMCMYTCCKSMCMYTYKYSTILQFFILWIDLTCIYNTMFDRDTLSFGTIIVMSKVALTAGSSQQGKARLASAGWKI